MKGIIGKAVIVALATTMIGGVSALAADKAEKTVPARGTWEYEEALQAGTLPAQAFHAKKVKDDTWQKKEKAELIRVLDRVYRPGLDTP